MRFSKIGLPNHGHELEDAISVDGIDRHNQKQGTQNLVQVLNRMYV